MKRPIIRSAAFVRAAKRLLKRQLLSTEELRTALTLLMDDAFDPKLRTHKLKGELGGD